MLAESHALAGSAAGAGLGRGDALAVSAHRDHRLAAARPIVAGQLWDGGAVGDPDQPMRDLGLALLKAYRPLAPLPPAATPSAPAKARTPRTLA